MSKDKNTPVVAKRALASVTTVILIFEIGCISVRTNLSGNQHVKQPRVGTQISHTQYTVS
jgi:hypothetical protein